MDKYELRTLLEKILLNKFSSMSETERSTAQKINKKLVKFFEFNDLKYVDYASVSKTQREFARLVYANSAVNNKIWTTPLFCIFKNKIKTTKQWVVQKINVGGKTKILILNEIIKRVNLL